MFCPQCGTKTVTGNQRFCRECGAEIGAASSQANQTATGTDAPARGSYSAPAQRPCMLTHVNVKDSALKTLLMAAGLLLLLPLVFGTLLAGVVAVVAVAALAIKLAPVVVLGLVAYWFITRRRLSHAGR